jgi:hypothetical protein
MLDKQELIREIHDCAHGICSDVYNLELDANRLKEILDAIENVSNILWRE